jgi:hypothetical protein
LLKVLTKADWDESEHPRDEDGKFAFGGGGGDGGESGTVAVVSDHPGQGYSKEARIKDGKIFTSDVYDAARALHENRKVELDQPRTLSTLITHLGKVANEMKARGEAAPNYNLCNVSIKGTNLFCAGSKDIPRPKMPQFTTEQTIEFRKHLQSLGYKEVEASERSDFLRATQSELNGVKVARVAGEIRTQTWPQEKRLVVSRDNYILDGHHLWAAQIANDAEDGVLGDAKTDIARVDIDIVTLLNEAKKFGAGYEAENRKLRDWDEGKHPREPAGSSAGGQFAGGGGGGEGGDDSSISVGSGYDHKISGLPPTVKISDRLLNQAIARDAYTFSAVEQPKGKFESGGPRYELSVTARIPSGIQKFEARPGRPEYYDPRLAELHTVDAGQKYLERVDARPKEGLTTKITPLPDKDIIYRGMAAEEYQAFLKTGEIKSRGDYNFPGQEGLTYWAKDVDTAVSYANGFAPWSYKATFEKPAYVVATRMPKEVRNIRGAGDNEVGVARPITKDEVVGVWRGDVFEHTPGEYTLKPVGYSDTEYEVGSGVGVSSSVVWSELEKDSGDKIAVSSGSYGPERQMASATPEQFVAARNESERAAFLSDKSADELKNDKLSLSRDGHTGYALDPKNDLQNLFNNGPKGGGKVALVDAIKNGAETLDAFDSFLPRLYAAHGFVVTGRIKFNDEFAPAGWDYAKDGRPDIVFMRYAGGDRETIEDRIGKFEPYDRSQGSYFTDYDSAKAASRSAGVGKGLEHGLPQLGGGRAEHGGRRQLSEELESPYDRSEEAGKRLRVEDSPRRIYVRSSLVEAHRLISKIEASGDIEIVPYDGEYIPGTELVDPREWDESLHPRDEAGRFGFGGGGGGEKETQEQTPVENLHTNIHEHLEKLGVTSTPQAKEWLDNNWDTMGVTPEKFKELVSGGLPTQSVNLGVFIPRGSLAVDVVYQNKAGYFSYDMMPKGGTVHADVLRVRPEGSGFGKKVMANVVELFKRNGNTKIELYANIKVGAYAWAKYGFVPSAKQWKDLQQIYEARASFLPEADQARINKILTINDPRAIWAIADDPRGGDMMLGENLGWDGHIDLGDEQAMRRFNAYIATRPKEAQ